MNSAPASSSSVSFDGTVVVPEWAVWAYASLLAAAQLASVGCDGMLPLLVGCLAARLFGTGSLHEKVVCVGCNV